jgi:two-component system cell cycle sensor histidine kinase/response regulator CckA
LFGQRLNDSVIEEFASNAGVRAGIVRSATLHSGTPGAVAHPDSIAIRIYGRDSIVGIRPLFDIAGNPACFMRIVMDRSIFRSGWVAVTIANYIVAFLLVIFGIIIWSLIRTIRRAEATLLQAEKLKALGMVAGGIAHDFNNLLTGIYGYINLAQVEIKEDTVAHKELSEAARTLHRARHLTRQLLTFAKGGEPVKKAVSITRLLNDIVPFALSGSSHKPVMSLPDNLWACEADEHQIEEVIENIVINARQAMNEAGIIEITAENIPSGSPLPGGLKPGNHVKVSIRDQGKGIPPEHLGKIFDPFFSTKPEGTGLGLAVAHSIIKKHNGLISVESKACRGTQVSFYLPALTKTVEEVSPAATLPEPERKGVVLLVDDDELVLMACRRMLSKIGYTVETAGKESEALEIVRRYISNGSSIPVGIIDLTIKGGVGGVEIIRSIKKIDPSFTAIVSSGYSESSVMANPSVYGAFTVLPKPYTFDELSRIMAESFRHAQQLSE